MVIVRVKVGIFFGLEKVVIVGGVGVNTCGDTQTCKCGEDILLSQVPMEISRDVDWASLLTDKSLV